MKELPKPIEKFIYFLERHIKSPIFGCKMCGQCVLHQTLYVCPMRCPKGLRDGPCGGASAQGKCERYPDRDCIWVLMYRRAKKKGKLEQLKSFKPVLDHRLVGTSSWVNLITGKIDVHGRSLLNEVQKPQVELAKTKPQLKEGQTP